MVSDIMHEWISMGLLVVFMGISVVLAGPLLVEASSPIIEDYQDKTVLNASGSIVMEQLDGKTGADLLMSLANTDINVPYPRAIRFNNSRVIKLDNAFQADLAAQLSYIYLHDGLKEMLDWKVIDIIYVYTTHDDKLGDLMTDLSNDDNPANDYVYGFGVDTSVEGYWQYILQAP